MSRATLAAALKVMWGIVVVYFIGACPLKVSTVSQIKHTMWPRERTESKNEKARGKCYQAWQLETRFAQRVKDWGGLSSQKAMDDGVAWTLAGDSGLRGPYSSRPPLAVPQVFPWFEVPLPAQTSDMDDSQTSVSSTGTPSLLFINSWVLWSSSNLTWSSWNSLVF